MCGIYLTNIPYEKEEVLGKLESISFRGPDFTGYQRINDVILGHLRLSILDLDPRSNQPMAYENLHIVYNGEIYNYLDIKDELISLGHSFSTESDTEVLLLGYKAFKEKILDKINGMYAFSIYDKDTNIIFSARDRLGVKPFYYYHENGDFEICSQIKPLLKGKKINEEAISIFLDCKFIPSPFTIVEEVHKLPPGNYMIFDLKTKEKKIKEYWNLSEVRPSNISYEEAKEKLRLLLLDATKIRLQSDVPIGSFLSGGIDSALVSALAAEVSEEPINTFSIGFEDPKFDESKVAEQYAKIIQSKHQTTICKIEDILRLIPKIQQVYGEPFADISALPSLLLNSVTKKYVTVALSGDGGDESFIGYTHFDSLVRHRPVINLPYFIRKFFSKPIFLKAIGQNNDRVRNALNTRTKNNFIENIFSRRGMLLKQQKEDYMKYYQGYKYWSSNFIQKAADLNIKLWLENDSNVKVDRASMAYSVEVRSPFLDYRIVEFARTLPLSYRYQRGRQKRILRDILKEYIPEEVFNQPKMGFSAPIGDWMRNELRADFDKALSEDFLTRVPNLNVAKFKKIYRDHMEQREDHSESIWKLYVLSLWYKEFERINN